MDRRVMAVRPAVFLSEDRRDAAIEPPQREMEVAQQLGLGAGFQLFTFETQRRRRDPTQAAKDQAGDHEEEGQSTALTTKPVTHETPRCLAAATRAAAIDGQALKVLRLCAMLSRVARGDGKLTLPTAKACCLCKSRMLSPWELIAL